MAIRRCPYCKAIIDEQDKYCNNCGTQLLFPEDEFVEEEIPGDKIIDEPPADDEAVEEPEEPEEIEEGAGEREQVEEGEQEELKEEEEEEEDKKEDGNEKEEEEKDEEEDKEEDEEEEKEQETDGDTDELELEAEEEKDEEEELKEEEEIEELAEKIETGELTPGSDQVGDSQKKYKVSIEEDELVFRTKDMDGLTGEVEEKEEKREAVTPAEAPAISLERKKPAPTTGEILPPWARGMKEEPSQEVDLEKTGETAIKDKMMPATTPPVPEWKADSGIGIPEKITQAALPFTTTAMADMAEEKEAVEEEEAERWRPSKEARARAGFTLKLRSKLVDLVFITALWVISLWFTAQVIGVSFLRLIVVSPIPVLAFYFILLLLYFFLFLFFLGETLGDHYFSGED